MPTYTEEDVMAMGYESTHILSRIAADLASEQVDDLGFEWQCSDCKNISTLPKCPECDHNLPFAEDLRAASALRYIMPFSRLMVCPLEWPPDPKNSIVSFQLPTANLTLAGNSRQEAPILITIGYIVWRMRETEAPQIFNEPDNEHHE